MRTNTAVIARPITADQIPCVTMAAPKVGETERSSSTLSGFSKGLSNALATFFGSPTSSRPLISKFLLSVSLTVGAQITTPSSNMAMRSAPLLMSLVKLNILSAPLLLSVTLTASLRSMEGVADSTSDPPSAATRLRRMGLLISLPSLSLLVYVYTICLGSISSPSRTR